MKIAIVTSNLGLKGGVEVFNRDLKKIFNREGHQVDIYGIQSLETTPEKDLEKKVGEHFNKVNEKKQYDLAICNGEFGYSVDHPRAINVFHGNYYGYALALKDLVPKELTDERLRRAGIQNESAKGKYVVTVSSSSKEQLEESGVPVDQIVPNSVDPEIFFPQEMPVGDHYIALARGRYYEKGFDIIGRLADKGMAIKLFSDRELENENIQNEGFVGNDTLREEYNKAKTLLFPSRFEGGSLTTLEAMACGCPIVTTPTGYGKDIKEDIKNLVAENFDEFFVKAILVANEREKYSKLALEYFNDNHHPNKFKENWLSLIKKI